MNSSILEPDERIDDLMINGLKIIQHEREFRFSLDAVLLAHFAGIKKMATAVDLGTGTGVISLLLAERGAGRVIGVELNPRMANMAARSVKMNKLDSVIEIIHADFRQLKGILPAGEWELVVANPPYRSVGNGFLNAKEGVAAARHELTSTLADVVQAAKYLVKYRGRFAMVHLPERMVEVLAVMKEAGLEPKRLRLVYPDLEKKPKLMLVEGVRGARPGLDVLAPLFIYQQGQYSPEIMTYYGQAKEVIG